MFDFEIHECLISCFIICLILNINYLLIYLCTSADGSWLMAKGGQGRRMAHGSWPRGAGPALGPRERQVRPGPGPALPRASGSGRPPLAMSHEPSLASLGHEP